MKFQNPRVVLTALTLVAGPAAAQSAVTFYGVIDTGIERISNVSPSGASMIRLPSQGGGLAPSRWGMRASEDLGGGLKASFVLEGGFSPDKGTNSSSQGGRLFGRSAWVGLSGDWGTFSLGRQYNMYFWSLLDADAMGPGIYGLAALDFAIPAARSDNTLAYRGTWAGFTAGATYSLGRDSTSCGGEVAGNFQACKEYSLLGKYDTKEWGAALAMDVQRGGPGAAASFASSNLSDTRRIANAYVKLGSVKLSGGLIKRNNEGATTATLATLPAKTDLSFIEADWAATPAVTVTPLLARLRWLESTDGSRATLYSVRAAYTFTRRTAAYLTVGRMSNKGSSNLAVSSGQVPLDNQPTVPGAGRGQNGIMIGMRHNF